MSQGQCHAMPRLPTFIRIILGKQRSTVMVSTNNCIAHSIQSLKCKQPTTEVIPRVPPLPVEVVENIIQEAWSLDMIIPERISLFTNLCLVNHTWLSIFIRVALIDVHIVSPAFAEKYLYLLHEPSGGEPETSLLLSDASRTANRLCRSITFHVDNNPNRHTDSAMEPAIRMYADKNRMGDSVSNVLYMINSLDYTPNLERVCLDYVDWGFGDVFDQMRLVPLPLQVSELEIKYSFSEELRSIAGSLRRLYYRKPYPTWKTPNVRKLTVAGAPALLVNAFVQTCPNLEVLEVSGLPYFSGLIEKMPESLRAMVLQLERGDAQDERDSPLEGKEDDYGLEQCVMRRWFEDNSTQRKIIIVRAEPPSQIKLAESVRRRARRYGLEVVSH